MNDLLGSQKIGVIGRFFVIADDIFDCSDQFGEMGRAEMPVMVLSETGIICLSLWPVEVDPEQFPWVFIRTDVGVFPGTVEEETVPCVRSSRNHPVFGQWFAVGDFTAAGEHDKKQVGVKLAPPA